MEQQVTFIFCCYDSPSGYYALLETDGQKEDIEDPSHYTEGVVLCDSYFRITVQPGQHIFINEYPNDDEGVQRHLITVPSEPQAFEKFCQAAEQSAGLPIYQRILGYKKQPRKQGQRYDHTEDFSGRWLASFRTQTWEDADSRPNSLQEALSSQG